MKEEIEDKEGDKNKSMDCFFIQQSYKNHRRGVLSIRAHSPWASNENIMNFQSALPFTFLKARGFTFGINPGDTKQHYRALISLFLLNSILRKAVQLRLRESVESGFAMNFDSIVESLNLLSFYHQSFPLKSFDDNRVLQRIPLIHWKLSDQLCLAVRCKVKIR